MLLAAGLTVVPVTALAQPHEGGVPAAPPKGRILDRVVAIIEGQVLTQSELEFEARVLFVERGAVLAIDEPLDEEALRTVLEQVIAHRLLVLSADRLEAFTAEQADVGLRLVRFRRNFGSEEAFQAFLTRSGADVKHLTEVLKRNVRVGRIIDSRVRLRAQPSEEDLRRYFEQHAGDYPEGFEAARGRLRDKLRQAREKALAEEELAQVRASAQVRRVAPFSRETRQ